jgi:electron transfer flavoprotein alpha subunit
MTSLLLAEHDGRKLSPASVRTATAAAQLGAPFDILVAGKNCAAAAAEASGLSGARTVLLADDPLYAGGLAEPLAALILTKADRYDVLLAPATACGKAVMPRVAAALGLPQISEIVAVLAPDRFERPIYAGSILQTVRIKTKRFVLTVRMAAFAPAAKTGNAAIEAVSPGPDPGLSRLIEERAEPAEGKPDLETAAVVVSGGRGVGTGEGFALVERLAGKLHAAVGASRAAVDAGFAPNDCQIGQSGKTVAPDLYIAVGISGAIQHLAGMRSAKIVAAINKDPDAPIFQISDVGWTADLFTAIPALEEELGKQK